MPSQQETLILWIKESSNHALSAQIIHTCAKIDCTINECIIHHLGGLDFVIIEIYGKWNQIAELEIFLAKLQNESHDLTFQRLDNEAKLAKLISYEFELIILNKTQSLDMIIHYLSQRTKILKCQMRQFNARYTSGNMMIVQMVVGIDSEDSISLLREQFSDFCDQHNFDAVLEPLKY